MKNNLVNSTKTIFRLIRVDLVTNWIFILLALAAGVGLLVIINISHAVSYNISSMHRVFYPITLMGGGMVVTGMCFSELHQKNKSYSYLLLPATTLEKTAARLIVTTIGFIVIATFGYFFHSVLAALITALFLDTAQPVFNPFNRFNLWFIHLYIATQSVVFFGAVYFRKFTLVKTVLVLSGVAIVLLLFTMLVLRIVFFEYFNGLFTPVNHLSGSIVSEQAAIGVGKFLLQCLKIILYWLLAPFFWVLSYFRLRETEV